MENSIFSDISKAINENPETYTSYYITKWQSIEKFVLGYDGLKVDTFINNFKTELDYIRFSVVFSDLTNIYPTIISSQGESTYHLIKGDATFTMPMSLYASLIKPNNIHPTVKIGYYNRQPDELKLVLAELAPLIENELAIYHNSKFVMAVEDIESNGNMNWKMFNVQPSGDVGNWMVMENAAQTNSLPINFSRKDYAHNEELFNITIPYLKGIPMKELALILSDNHDLLSSFRTHLHTLVKQASAGKKTLDEMKHDLVKPEVDKLSHKFRRITELYKAKSLATSFGTVCVGLLTLTSSGYGALLYGLLSTGLGLTLKNQMDLRTDIDRLDDYPMSLMWKLKNAKR